MEENLYFNKENIHKLNDGDSLGKIIMGTILKYNNKINEEEEKKLAKEYQVLSKNTTLYAEFENEENSNLEMKSYNQVKKEIYNDYSKNIYNSNYNLDMQYAKPLRNYDLVDDLNMKIDFSLSGYETKAMMCAPKRSSGIKMSSGFNFFGLFKSKSNYSTKSKKIDTGLNYSKNNKIEREKKAEPVKKQFNLNDMILTQDIIDGFWNENEQTKFIISKYQKIYNLVENYLKGINSQEYKKMSVTFIILYYLRKDESKKLQSYMIIINKAELYLSNNGTSYNDIVLNNKI